MATPWGVATKTRSRSGVSEILSVNGMSTYPPRNGWTSATMEPAFWREVIAAISTSGCLHRMRASSLPVYPVPPIIPILVIFTTRYDAKTTDGM